MSWVYIVSDGEDIKIGKANDYVRRISELQTGNKKKLTLVRLIETETEQIALDLEHGLHKMCKKYRILGEWFNKDALDIIQCYTNEELIFITTL